MVGGGSLSDRARSVSQLVERISHGWRLWLDVKEIYGSSGVVEEGVRHRHSPVIARHANFISRRGGSDPAGELGAAGAVGSRGQLHAEPVVAGDPQGAPGAGTGVANGAGPGEHNGLLFVSTFL